MKKENLEELRDILESYFGMVGNDTLEDAAHELGDFFNKAI